ncbi:hypothetical protein C8R47DRAFT_1133389 [Mycena vitilis]|nr:hypothetical protein C8R47DRAFT_1133389 [Mycena vitilis]
MSSSFLRRFSNKGSRTHSLPRVHTEDLHQETFYYETSSPTSFTDARRTAGNVLKFSLQTLGQVSANIPFGGVLSGVINPLLAITERIEQTSDNEKGLVKLAARIELLTPIVSEMAESNPTAGRKTIKALQRELQSITEELEAAKARGKLNQFFNSVDNASVLEKHNQALTEMIATATFASVREVLESLRELERSKMLDSSPSEGINELGDITGGFGGGGGDARRTGGRGGVGEGPQLDLDPDDRWRAGNVSGGRGGVGGMADDVGGEGGTGKGPIITIRSYRRRVVVTQPQAADEFSIL